jgi:8-amino-7-oxononanoate synthase
LIIVSQEPERRRKLMALSRFLRDALSAAGITVPAGRSQIVPVILGDSREAVRVATALQAHGFDVRAIRPPTVPAGTARLRVSLNATLTEAALDAFVDTLSDALTSCRGPATASSSEPAGVQTPQHHGMGKM